MPLVRYVQNKFLDRKLDFRVRLFNVLAIAGTGIGALMALLGVISHAGAANVSINIFGAVLAFGLLRYSYATGRYRRCYIITIVFIFLLMFPALFFSSGGFHSGMPCFFVFAVLFTIFMLEGKQALIMSAVEIIAYTGICLAAYFYPTAVNFFSSEEDILVDVIVAFISVSVALGITMFLHFRLYNEQQKKLAEQNAMLERLNELKTEFLSNVSHELKTPLSIMSLIAQNSRSELAEQPEFVELSNQMRTIAAEADRLGLMVSQILDMTRIDEGRMAIHPQLSGINEIIQQTISNYYPMLKKNSNRLIARQNFDLPNVMVDPDRISQVLVNLLQNAIRHTRNGAIDISSKIIEGDGRTGSVEITVKDTGEGIEPERLPVIFERFVSHDSKKVRGGKDTGTGLGLYICKHIVEAHGGTISVESELNKGTTVRFTIPAQQQAV